jgi:hypothetical protein
VTTIYVDRAAMLDDSHGARGFSDGALRSLGFLRDAGHAIVMVTDPSDEIVEAGPAGDWTRIPLEALPIRPSEAAWYLTTDADRCQGRSARLRTVLVGSTPAPAAIHRCDALARDVPAAVLEILAAEAMTS